MCRSPLAVLATAAEGVLVSVKTSALGALIYAALALYTLAFVAGGARRRAGRVLFAAGCGAAAGAVAWRGFSTGHIPLQNLFEVFLAMGALLGPLALAWSRLPGAAARTDPLLGAVVLFPAGFVFSEQPRPLPPALQSPLFAPHVLAYLCAYVLLFKAAALAAAQFRRRRSAEWADLEASAHRLVEWGYPLLTLGLVLGAVWGKLAWGNYWHWDPKEMWALATWLIYTGYFHARTTLPTSARRARAALLLAGFGAIVLTLTWVNLSRLFPGLHSYAT